MLYKADIEKIARDAKFLLERLIMELAVGEYSEEVKGSLHPQTFTATEHPPQTFLRVAFALGLGPANAYNHSQEEKDNLAKRIRSEITGEPIEVMTEEGVKTAPEEVPAAPLPDDFPARDKLAAAGITTYAEAHKVADAGTLTEIEGIGQATAEKIQAALLPQTID